MFTRQLRCSWQMPESFIFIAAEQRRENGNENEKEKPVAGIVEFVVVVCFLTLFCFAENTHAQWQCNFPRQKPVGEIFAHPRDFSLPSYASDKSY